MNFITAISLLFKLFFNPKLAIGIYLVHSIDEKGQVIADVKSGKIIYANQSFLNHVGRTIEEFRETPFVEFVENKEETKSAATKLKSGHTLYDFENVYIRPDGTGAKCIWRALIFNGLYICTVRLK